jgi:hypothetical protein
MTDLILMAVIPGVILVAITADVLVLLELIARCWAMLMKQSQ